MVECRKLFVVRLPVSPGGNEAGLCLTGLGALFLDIDVVVVVGALSLHPTTNPTRIAITIE
jgi:hypothetical protein